MQGNILGYADANSTEMNEHTISFVNLWKNKKTVTDKGGTCD
jgi:CTP synthase